MARLLAQTSFLKILLKHLYMYMLAYVYARPTGVISGEEVKKRNDESKNKD